MSVKDPPFPVIARQGLPIQSTINKQTMLAISNMLFGGVNHRNLIDIPGLTVLKPGGHMSRCAISSQDCRQDTKLEAAQSLDSGKPVVDGQPFRLIAQIGNGELPSSVS